MNPLEALRIAFSALSANKMRAALTTLGVVIGVAAVIAMTALGQGAAKDVQARLNKLGSNLIFVAPGQAGRGPIFMGFGSADTLSLENAEKLRRSMPELIAGVEAEVSSSEQVKFGTYSSNYRIVGTYSDYSFVRNPDIADGRFFSRLDEEAARRVCVVGSNVARDVIKSGRAVGKRIKIKGIPFEVVGALAETGGFGRQDDQVFIPLRTFVQRINFRRYASNIGVSARDGKSFEEVQAGIRRFLRREHKLRPSQKDDFSIASQTDIASTLNDTNRIFTMLLAGIAAISLVVGGIGIMNIMLVTVTERTREIGIRKALGARKRDIQLQFLIESCVLSILGGLLGVAMGLGTAHLMQTKMGLTVDVKMQSVVLSFGCAAAIGIFFGFYPASRAAALDPIQALRYE
ncbi:MAG: ABC transporter permease [Armatimonadetes bacterium]|nr:ABC transporter permease [Armatimonadota bacterium]